MVHGPDEECVAVGLRPGDDGRPDGATRSCTIVDDHLLANLLRQLRRERPRERIGTAARRERHDERDGFGRPCLCTYRRHRHGSRQAGCQQGPALHTKLIMHVRYPPLSGG
jgi:hypothetical protein